MKNRVKIHLYTLTPRGAPNSRTTGSARTGALLRVEFADEEIGYADCFPWPELGDAPLSAQLNSIKTGYLTPVTARSLYFASKDAQARLTDKYNNKCLLPVPAYDQLYPHSTLLLS